MDLLRDLLGVVSPSAAAAYSQGTQAVGEIAGLTRQAKTWATIAIVLLGVNTVALVYLVSKARR